MPSFQQIQQEFSPKTYFQVIKAIEQAVVVSAKEFPLRLSMKDQEIEARVAWCCAQAVVLRKVMIWSTERICDALPGALSTYLRTGSWEPPEHRPRVW